MSNVKNCPDLVRRQEYKANIRGMGDCIVPVPYPCLLKRCAAYDEEKQYCNKYKNSVIIKE